MMGLPAGPWRWWTSNSWRRLTAHNLPGGQYKQEGDVLCPIVAKDGHPDLAVSEEVMAAIAAVPEMMDALKNLLGVFDNAAFRLKLAGDTFAQEAIATALAALAKAEGRG